jgi:hypothetical protein
MSEHRRIGATVVPQPVIGVFAGSMGCRNDMRSGGGLGGSLHVFSDITNRQQMDLALFFASAGRAGVRAI